VAVKERLQKYLARAGIASRRKAEDLIVEGRVSVNGKLAELGMSVVPADTVRVDGKRVEREVPSVTYMLNKPAELITTLSDELGRDTVMSLVPKIPGLHPVGRLDKDSEGLLLLTTDGQLTLQLTHPRYEHEKEYRIWTREGTLTAAALAILEQGIELEDGPAKAIVAKLAEGGCILVIAEGRNRQVRRMLASVGYLVTRLIRTRIAKLELGELATGEYRELSSHDLALLGYTLPQVR
jgi:23S rRNA pseudouridine2605 synthase